jgi:hypothetical protein
VGAIPWWFKSTPGHNKTKNFVTIRVCYIAEKKTPNHPPPPAGGGGAAGQARL